MQLQNCKSIIAWLLVYGVNKHIWRFMLPHHKNSKTFFFSKGHEDNFCSSGHLSLLKSRALAWEFDFFFLSLGEETTQAFTVENISKMVMHVQLRLFVFLNFSWMFLMLVYPIVFVPNIFSNSRLIQKRIHILQLFWKKQNDYKTRGNF